MKTARSAPPVHGGHHQYRSTKSSTPLASPRMLAHSVGQPYPPKASPKLSPGVGPRQSPGSTQDARGSSPSYFGLVIEPATDPRDSGVLPRDNWSSPSSSIKSFAAALPKQLIPLDANPAYDAFRRQADANYHGRSFALGVPQLGSGKSPVAGTVQMDIDPTSAMFTRSKPSKQRSTPGHAQSPALADVCEEPVAKTSEPMALARTSWLQASHGTPTDSTPASSVSHSMDIDTEASSLHDSAYVSSDSKRNSESSMEPPLIPNAPRFESPAQLENTSELKIPTSHSEPRPRFPMTLGKLNLPPAKTGAIGKGAARSEPAPAKLDNGFSMMDVSQLKEIIDLDASQKTTALLLLDVRVSTYYAMSRIRGALNLCIPTTLLKRATFNLHKMQSTFASGGDQEKFSTWRDAQYLVVYDSSSAEKRDAVAAMNMLRKFTNEGYKGEACVLRGGYKAFEDAYPGLIDYQSTAPASGGTTGLSLEPSGNRGLSIAPIIGGVMLPTGSGNPNPFFSNIRQNVELANGVGRLDIALPSGVDVSSLPTWLRDAANPSDHGQKVSEKFLKIEQAEQSRMKHAYGAFNSSTQDPGLAGNVQLSGIEKGGKNRYKDILPFEHARVRLRGRPAGACDYVNASHIRASRSYKRYIASQGPLPATFEDFWSMIWDEDVRVIVMLTAESEGGQLKCHSYWTSKEYGPVKLRLLSEKKVSLDIDKHRSNSTISGSVSSAASVSEVSSASESGRRRAHTLVSTEGKESTPSNTRFPGSSQSQSSEAPFVVIRKFALSHSSQPFSPIREVTQLHYASWPDFGAPAQPSHLLALVELANVMQHSASPMDIPVSLPKAATFSGTQQNSPPNGNSKLDCLFWPWHDEPESNVNSRPMLVHCSAGCGRTGTFCTVDSVIDMLKRQNQRSLRRANAAAAIMGRRYSNVGPSTVFDNGDVAMQDAADSGSVAAKRIIDPDNHFDPSWLDSNSVDLVAQTVEDFRTQRLSMVQSLRQFVLCYETITEWVANMQDRRGSSIRGPGRARSESMRISTA